MSDYNLTGAIKEIRETQEFDSGFKKREFVVTTNEEYPQDIKMEFFRDKCDILNKYKVGDAVTVWFNLGGREWDGKYFVNVNAWRIAMTSDANFEGIKQDKPAKGKAILPDENLADDLPF